MAIQVRRGTNAEWENTKQNIVAGEPAVALDSERFFVGTGTGTYAEYANVKSIAPTYSTTRSYREGDYVMYNGKLYICASATSGGAWNAANWEESSILEALTGDAPYRGYETASVSGNVVSFDNGAGGIPVKDLEVEIKAVQDLHGYDYPWVGGAGKNKAKVTLSSGTYYNVPFTVDDFGRITTNGVPSSAVAFPVAEVNLVGGTSYILSGGVDEDYRLYIQIDGTPYTSGSTESSIFTPTTSGKYDINIVVTTGASVGDTVSPMIRLATETDATFAPYANICPISGWDEVNVNVRGKNLWTGDSFITKATGSFYIGTGNTLASAYPISIPKGTVYFSADWQGVGAGQEIQMFYADGTKERFGTNPIPANSHFERSVTLEKDAVGIFAYINQAGTLSNIMLTYEENADYVPYNGQTYTIDLDGTRYGGTLDVTTGVLTIDKVEVDLGTLDWVANGTYANTFNGTYLNPIANVPSVGTNWICSQYKAYDSSTVGTVNAGISLSTNRFTVYVRDTRYSDTATFKTAMDGVQLVYELATPQTVQLSPIQVETLLRDNVIWADSGKIINCTYRITNT